jgi:aspartyl-tRNA(Asn)/glutamyl-tRNA(Gln) amidotransferase subunit C
VRTAEFLLPLTTSLYTIENSLNIDEKRLRELGQLARLRLSESQLQTLPATLASVLDWMSDLNRCDIAGVTHLMHPGDPILRTRIDVVSEQDHVDQYQRSAPQISSGYYLVPKVLE